MDAYDQAVTDREALERFETVLPDDIPLTTDEKLDELLRILSPLEPFIAALPEMMAKVDPLLEGLKGSPVLKMIGVKW